MTRYGLLLVTCLAAGPAAAQDNALDRLRALSQPEPAPADSYADDIAADLAVIGAEAGVLFDSGRPGFGPTDAPVAMAIFVDRDCAPCPRAQQDLADLAERLDVRVAVIDVSAAAEDAALMERLSLDMLPSYVMRDRMIRGAMPAMALERYLSE